MKRLVDAFRTPPQPDFEQQQPVAPVCECSHCVNCNQQLAGAQQVTLQELVMLYNAAADDRDALNDVWRRRAVVILAAAAILGAAVGSVF